MFYLCYMDSCNFCAPSNRLVIGRPTCQTTKTDRLIGVAHATVLERLAKMLRRGTVPRLRSDQRGNPRRAISNLRSRQQKRSKLSDALSDRTRHSRWSTSASVGCASCAPSSTRSPHPCAKCAHKALARRRGIPQPRGMRTQCYERDVLPWLSSFKSPAPGAIATS